MSVCGAVRALVLLLAVAGPAAAADFTVTRFDDPSPVACAPTDCSLREAILAANLVPGADAIALPAGTYTLTITGVAEDAAATGDLDITADLTITGDGAADTIIQAGTVARGGIDRVFDVRAGTSGISAVTVRNGYEPGTDGESGENGGGGVRVRAGATLVLQSVVVAANYAAGTFAIGGGIRTEGSVSMENSTLRDNWADNVGGGFANIFGAMALTNVTVSGNHVFSFTGGGGIYSVGFGAGLSNVTITANTGSGFFNDTFPTPIKNTIIAGNSQESGLFQNCRLVNGAIDDRGYNLGPSECGFSTEANDVIITDPMLGALADNGGATPTHAVLQDSDALDSGNPATPGSGGDACPATDQRGVARPQPSDGRCDIGAFELAPEPPTTTTTSSTSTSTTSSTSSSSTTSTTSTTSSSSSTSSSTSTTESTTTTSSTSTSSTSTSSTSTSTSSTSSTSTSTSSSTTSSTSTTTSSTTTSTSTPSTTTLRTTTTTSSSTTTTRRGGRPNTTTSTPPTSTTSPVPTTTSTSQPGATTTSTTLRPCGGTYPACNGTCSKGTCTVVGQHCRCQ